MTTTTDLLRRAAEGMADLAGHCEQLLPPEESYAAQCRADAASLLALADQMERAEPVANENAPPTHDFNVCDLDGASRRWAHKQAMTRRLSDWSKPGEKPPMVGVWETKFIDEP